MDEVFMEDPRDLPRDGSMCTRMAVAGGSKVRALRDAGSAEKMSFGSSRPCSMQEMVGTTSSDTSSPGPCHV